jgi:hypothetical protein
MIKVVRKFRISFVCPMKFCNTKFRHHHCTHLIVSRNIVVFSLDKYLFVLLLYMRRKLFNFYNSHPRVLYRSTIERQK